MNIYLSLFSSFFKIGAFTIGGGYAMIPLIEKETIETKKWFSPEEFMQILTLGQSVPGVMSINIAIIIGYKLRGFKGSLISALGCALPSFISILMICICFSSFSTNATVASIFKGIRPAVVALIASVLWRMGKNANLNYITVLIPIAVALCINFFTITPIWFIIIGGIGGVIYGKLVKRKIENQNNSSGKN